MRLSARALLFGLANLGFAWSAVALATVPWWPVYRDGHFVLAVAGAVFLASIPAVVGTVLRWPSWAVLLGAALVFSASGVQLAVPAQATAGGLLPSVDGLRDLALGSALGWRRLVTITVPVGDYQSLLVPLYFAVFATTAASVSLALRLRRGELGALPVLLLFAAGVAFGPAVADVPAPAALAETVVLLLWVVWRRARRRGALERGRAPAADAVVRGGALRTVRILATATVILLVASGASLAATSSLPPSTDRVVLRTVVEQPFDPRQYASPLASFRSNLKDGRADRTMLEVRGLPSGARIRIATLDSYDGVVYAVGASAVDDASGTFTRVPTSVDRTGQTGRRISVRMRVLGYRGVWLPTVGDLASVRFTGDDAARARDAFFFNRTTGTGAVLGGMRAGDDYATTAVLPRARSLESLGGVAPGGSQVPEIRVYPDGLSVKLDSYVRGIDGTGAQLVAAIQGLRREGYISHGLSDAEPPSRSGHSRDRITELLTAQRMIGDAEQYAVAAALMARQLGFPARVVYGFAPGEAGTVRVTGSDISAWIEVDTAQFGWVTVDPVPPVRPIPDEQPKQPTQISRPQTPVDPPPDEPQVRDPETPPDTTQDQAQEDPALVALLAGLRVAGVALGLAALIALPLIVVVATKAVRRRRRRRSGPPVERITGAWDEFRDEALDYGYAPAGRLTRIEFADRVGLEQPRTLAAVVDRAVFAPDAPGAAEAERVWSALGEITDSLGRGLTRRQRIRARISLRSLRRRRK